MLQSIKSLVLPQFHFLKLDISRLQSGLVKGNIPLKKMFEFTSVNQSLAIQYTMIILALAENND